MTLTSDDIARLDLIQASDLLAAGTTTSRALTEALLGRIAALDPALHACEAVLTSSALAQADAADRAIAAGRRLGPLHGIPLAIKDLCWVKDSPTAAGTVVHRDFLPPEDATVVRRLREAGAVLIGKTRLTEGAWSDYHPSVEPVRHPRDPAYWAGISSSGSAVAVAAGLCFGAIASDTGGSIRWPAAANGVTGLKPTWGRVSRHGVFELAASLDHVGPMARTSLDTALLFETMAGSDPLDPTTSLAPVPACVDAAKRGASGSAGATGLSVGIDRRWNREGVDTAVEDALAEAEQTLAAAGARIVDLAFPDVEAIIDDWGPNCAVEAAVAHEATFPARAACYGPILASVLRAGAALSGPDYQRILLRRARFRGRVDRVLATVDLVLTPVQPFAPLTLAEVATLGTRPDLIHRLQRYTCPFNMSGHPTLTLPAGQSRDGLPIGLQLIAAAFRESVLFQAGAAFQAATPWHRPHR